MRVNSCSGSGRHRLSEERLHLAVRFAASLPYFSNLLLLRHTLKGRHKGAVLHVSIVAHTLPPRSSIFRWLFITAAVPHRGGDKCRIRALVTRGPLQNSRGLAKVLALIMVQPVGLKGSIRASILTRVCVCARACVWMCLCVPCTIFMRLTMKPFIAPERICFAGVSARPTLSRLSS